MGISKAHEEPIKWLEKRYGKGEDRKLIDVYEGDLSKWSKRPHRADYIGNNKDCNAYVEVIYGGEWRCVLGKVIAYAYEVE